MTNQYFFKFLLIVGFVCPGAVLAFQTSECPSPEAVLGFQVGADFKLASYEESLNYFRQLDSCSDHVQLVQAGRTSEDRPWYVALISNPENLENLETHRQTAQRLAHPEGLTDAQARQLARQGKAIVDINGGLHASEVAGAQHTIKFAYQLVSLREEPRVKEILQNVIVMVWPSLNPDGQDIVANWYRGNLGTPYEVAPLLELYQKYIGHDNNRDAYMLNMVESRVLARSWRHWEPQIIYVHHQTAPFPTRIWLPPFAEPVATQTPPIMSRTVNLIGMAIARGLEARGMPGATHMGTGYDAWYPGYVDYLPMLQHRAAFWTETALYRYATPHFYTVSDFPARDRSLRNETLYSSPWKGGWWRLMDAVDYIVEASFSVAEFAAKYREDLLFDRYQSGRDTIRKYTDDPPYAYFVPQRQRDPVAAPELLRRLAFNGIQISQLAAAVSHQGMSYPAGTWVIPMNQPFAEVVRQLLDIQTYPDLREFPEGPPEQPYDAAGWTLPFQMDVNVAAATAPLTEQIRSALRPVRGTAMDWEQAYIRSADQNGIPVLLTACHGQVLTATRWQLGSCLRRDPFLETDPICCWTRRRTMPSAPSIEPVQPGARFGSWGPPRMGVAERDSWCRDLQETLSKTGSGNWPSRQRGHRVATDRRSDPASDSTVPGEPAWTKAGRAGCSSNMSFPLRTFTTAISRPTCRIGSTSLSCPQNGRLRLRKGLRRAPFPLGFPVGLER